MLYRLLLLACFAFSLQASAQADLKPFPKTAPVQKDKATPGTLLTVPLPAKSFEFLNDWLGNLLIVDGNGYAVPYLRNQASDKTEKTVRIDVKTAVKTLRIGDGNEIAILVDRDTKFDTPINGLTIVTGLRDFQQTVSVYSRPNNDADWQPLTKDAVIFDYSRFMDVRETRVSFPETSDRHFRLVVADAMDERLAARFERVTRDSATPEQTFDQTRQDVERRPFRIDTVRLFRTVRQIVPNSLLLQDYPPTSSTKSIDAKTGHTVYELSTQREPLTKIRFITKDENFSRRVVLEEPYDTETGQRWRTIVASQIYSIGSGDNRKEKLAINFPEKRAAQLRLTVENGALAPLSISAVEPSGPIYQALFIVPKTDELNCYFGGEHIGSDYDSAAIDHLLKNGAETTMGSLGGIADNPHADPDVTLSLLGHPAVFGGAILLVVAVLAWALFRAGKKLEEPASS